jgi:hypothetical protein
MVMDLKSGWVVLSRKLDSPGMMTLGRGQPGTGVLLGFQNFDRSAHQAGEAQDAVGFGRIESPGGFAAVKRGF